MTFRELYQHRKHPADMSFDTLACLFYDGNNTARNWVFPINFEDFTRPAPKPDPEKDSRPKD